MFSSLLLSGGILPISEALASEQASQEITSTNKELNDSEVKQIEQFIHFNEQSEEFILDEQAINIIGIENFNLAQQMVTKTNQQIAIAKQDNSAVIWVQDTDGNEICVTPYQTMAYGKNDVQFHWNYARIFLNKGTVQAIGAGLSIGGIWVPEPIVSKVAASLGVGIALIPHGIWFDYNYFIGVLTGNFGFQ